MTTKVLMVSSAAFMAALGLATTFMPQEIIASLGGSAGRTLPLLVQILGALYFDLKFVPKSANVLGHQTG